MKTFLIRTSCDGSVNDDIIFGSFDDMIDRFLQLSYFGTREEAFRDLKDVIERIRNVEMNWNSGRFDEELEQGYVLILELQNENVIERFIKESRSGVIGGIKLVRHFSKGLVGLKQAKEYVEGLRS